MNVIRKYHIKPDTIEGKECERLCTSTANLYNECLKSIYSHYKQYSDFKSDSGYIFTLTNLYSKFKTSDLYKFDALGNKLNSKIMKTAFKLLHQNFNSYYQALKSYYKTPKKFKGKPKFPKLKKEQLCTIVDNDAYSLKGNFIHISMTKIKIDIQDLLKLGIKKCNLRELRITPTTYGYIVTIIYKVVEIKNTIRPTNIQGMLAGIDIGMNNLAALAFNTSAVTPCLIDGRKLKSINQFYNKQLTSFKSKLKRKEKTSKRIRRLTQKRNNKILHELHCTSKFIVNLLVKNGIECLIVGSNKQWKSKINLGKRTNQNFVQIPFYKFKQMLKYKCELVGIHYIEREESYTSKCSFLDLEPIKKHEKYLGSRVKRGLFKSNKGIKVNADINGALNIIRKEFGEEYFNPNKLTKLFSGVKIIKIKSDS